jgi:hypothetical protein
MFAQLAIVQANQLDDHSVRVFVRRRAWPAIPHLARETPSFRDLLQKGVAASSAALGMALVTR